jgi:fibronectin type III domain protein
MKSLSRRVRFWMAPLLAAGALRADVYVSPGGNDGNDGSPGHPVRTLAHARDLARARPLSAAGGITIYLADGTYRLAEPLVLSPADSGRNGFDVVYAAEAGAHPIISGGIRVTGWTLVDAGRNLWRAPAPAALHATRQLYVDGVRAPRTQGRLPVSLKMTATGYVASAPVMAAWRNPGDLEFVYTGGNEVWSEGSYGLGAWTEPRCPVASIAGETITMAQPAWDNCTKRVMFPDRSFNRPANLVGPVSVGKRPEYVENAYELLGTPGQWYFDRAARLIYYTPRPGEDLSRADVEAPRLERLIVGRGTPEDPVHNLVFRGLQFSYATWVYPSSPEGFPEIQANYLVTGPGGYASQGLGSLYPGGTFPYGNWTKTPGNLAFGASAQVSFLGDTFVHLGAAGLELGDGSQGDTVTGCVFTDISGNGLELGGVDQPEAPAPLVTRDNRILNNHFYNIGAEYHGGIAIVVGYAQRTVIAHNQIDHVPYSGISIGWGGWPDKVRQAGVANNSERNLIDENLIFAHMLVLADGAGIYTQGLTGPSLAAGERVSGNVVRDQFGSGHAIYSDNGSCNMTIAGNVMYHTNHDNWGGRHRDYYPGHHGEVNDPITVRGNYWQQGDPDADAENVRYAGNHLIGALAEVPARVLAGAGLEPAFRALLAEPSGPPVAPEPPRRVAAAAGAGFALVTWNPAIFEGGAPVESYTVTSSAGDRATLTAAEYSDRAFVRLDGLRNGVPYTFTVAATNAHGTSGPSLPSAPVTPEAKTIAPPSAPLHVEALLADGRASLHFQAPQSDGGTPITSYVFTVNPGGRRVVFAGRAVLALGLSKPGARPGHTIFGVVDDLPAGPAYAFTVAAVNAAGEGAPASASIPP